MSFNRSRAALWGSKSVFDSLKTFADFEQPGIGLVKTNIKAKEGTFVI
jgi:hypothetical protein